jgi:hypothetical protein
LDALAALAALGETIGGMPPGGCCPGIGGGGVCALAGPAPTNANASAWAIKQLNAIDFFTRNFRLVKQVRYIIKNRFNRYTPFSTYRMWYETLTFCPRRCNATVRLSALLNLL